MSSYFDSAPLSQVVFLITLSSMVIGDQRDAHNHSIFALDLNNVYKGEFHRIFLSPLFFRSTPQIVVGLILIYTTRQFERQMGTRKYSAFVFLSFIISLFLQIAFLVTFQSMGVDFSLAPGPFYYIFSSLPFFYYHIPKLRPSNYSIMGFSMLLSEKSWFYLLASQLLLSDGMSSFIPGLSGLLAGYTYFVEGFNLSSFRIPSFFEVN